MRPGCRAVVNAVFDVDKGRPVTSPGEVRDVTSTFWLDQWSARGGAVDGMGAFVADLGAVLPRGFDWHVDDKTVDRVVRKFDLTDCFLDADFEVRLRFDPVTDSFT